MPNQVFFVISRTVQTPGKPERRQRLTPDLSRTAILALASVFFLACTWTSYARWANFEYRTFDLAYYVQAIWQLIHGRSQVSVINVPLLGNHVEPIVFLFASFFAVFRHPMIFVVVQNAALASMGPVGYSIAKRFGFDGNRACLLAAALLITPTTGYIALHEFHPEALTAPLLLLLFHARLSNSLGRHWLWFVAVLACKENMALLLIAYCVVQCLIERKRPVAELRTWYLWPMGLAVLWLFLCVQIIIPSLNSGNIDYSTLYDRLGTSPGNILRHAVTQPQFILRAIAQSVTRGNLIWALLFPFLCLPLLRPQWLVITIPIVLQHLLSSRSSEWTIYFHYAAPLLPFFWISLAEAIAVLSLAKGMPVLLARGLPCLVIIGCAAAQISLGPAAAIVSETMDWPTGKSERARKAAFIASIPPEASVLAPFPYLAHLAMREKLYSLHYVLKGLKTLSHSPYQPPPPTDFVLIDYHDSATFDASAGYYHPTMRTVDGQIIPSSDQLLHNFLKPCSWVVDSCNELSLLRQDKRAAAIPSTEQGGIIFEVGNHTQLLNIIKNGNAMSNQQFLEIQMNWKFQSKRDVFPWMFLRLARHGDDSHAVLTKGLCAPEANGGLYHEIWRITSTNGLAVGDYSVEAIFVDNSRLAWTESVDRSNQQPTLLADPVPLGNIRVIAETSQFK